MGLSLAPSLCVCVYVYVCSEQANYVPQDACRPIFRVKVNGQSGRGQMVHRLRPGTAVGLQEICVGRFRGRGSSTNRSPLRKKKDHGSDGEMVVRRCDEGSILVLLIWVADLTSCLETVDGDWEGSGKEATRNAASETKFQRTTPRVPLPFHVGISCVCSA